MKDWILNKWYKKAAYVLGIIQVVLFIVGFLIGLVKGFGGA